MGWCLCNLLTEATISPLRFGTCSNTGLAGIVMMLMVAAAAMATEQRARDLATNFPVNPTSEELGILRASYAADRNLWPAPAVTAGIEWRELAPLPATPAASKLELINLGRHLFEDARLSASGQISCLTCHQPALGFGDGRAVAIGHEGAVGRRNSPSLFNSSHRATLFWDGRAASLQEQAVEPLLNPREMANPDLESIIARLNATDEYPAYFSAAFGSERIDAAGIVEALAAFQSTLKDYTIFDRFLAGDIDALTTQQIWGLHLFRTKAGCMNCHNGPLLTDDRFHNLGLSLLGRPREDLGRYDNTGQKDDAGRFRTPSLRHVSRTAPYMHNGIIQTLPLVIRFYEVGGGKTRPKNAVEAENPLMPFASRTSSLLSPFKLTDSERQALIAFLQAL